jgi:acid stress chaperone HdeB
VILLAAEFPVLRVSRKSDLADAGESDVAAGAAVFDKTSRHSGAQYSATFWGLAMKITGIALFAGTVLLSSAPAHAVVLDLSTLSCKQFIEGGEDEIKMVLTWMDGWYKGDEDEAIIDTEVFVANAKKFGAFCAANPNISIVNAAEKILGK